METAQEVDKRLNSRSNVFVMATLYGATGSAPVRIRNMSPHGALVEGGTLPPLGSPVQLCRGSLAVSGKIIRVDGGKAGLRFSSPMSVAEWLPGGSRGAGQQMADELVHRARLGATVAIHPTVAAETLPSFASEKLLRLRAELEKASEDLAADIETAARHAAPLQAIDAVAQALARLAGWNGVSNPEAGQISA